MICGRGRTMSWEGRWVRQRMGSASAKPSSVVPCSRNYGGQEGATGSDSWDLCEGRDRSLFGRG
jgi:hypothetical protein